jgi:alanine dehydrogenase
MLAFAPTTGLVGAKVACVVPENAKRGLNPHQGIVALFDSETGEVRATFDASEITAFRTVAMSLAATDCLSRVDSETHSVFGTGTQAHLHALHLTAVRPIRRITIVGRDLEKAKRLVARLRDELDSRIDLVATTEVARAARADIVSLCTASTNPYLGSDCLAPGSHVNAIGACRPTMREIDIRAEDALSIYVDDLERCREEAAEIRQFFTSELEQPLLAIGSAFAGESPRTSPNAKTLFKSVGVGLQDIVAAAGVLALAHSYTDLDRSERYL